VWAVKGKVLKVNAHATATAGPEQENAQRYLDKKAATTITTMTQTT
jgi:hypothetical protein